MLMKRYVLAALILLSMGCERRFIIYNACKGSWVKVREGRGEYIVDRLPYGQSAAPDIRGASGRSVELLAEGFSLRDNRPLGYSSTTIYIPKGGSITGPSQIRSWEITWLYPEGCER